VAFVDDRFAVFNICHFLFDKLGRVAELDGLAIDSYFLLLDHPYYNQVFSILGLNKTDLENATENIITYSFEKLYVSTSTCRFRHPGFNFRPEVMGILSELKSKSAIDQQELDLGKRIYIDRKGTAARDIVNQDALNAVLDKYGFVSVIFEDFGFSEQVKIVQEAEILLGVHGAGMSNAMFCDSADFKLLEIFPPMCATSDYWKLASAFNVHYDAYIAYDLEMPRPDYSTWQHNVKYNRRNILIDQEEFDRFLALNT